MKENNYFIPNILNYRYLNLNTRLFPKLQYGETKDKPYFYKETFI